MPPTVVGPISEQDALQLPAPLSHERTKHRHIVSQETFKAFGCGMILICVRRMTRNWPQTSGAAISFSGWLTLVS